MKKLITLGLMLLLSISPSLAKEPKKKSLATQVFTTDIVCHNCEQKIMNNVAVLGKGITDVKVNVNTKEVVITYDTKKNSLENLIKGFSKISVKAEPKERACPTKKAGCSDCKKKCNGAKKKSCCKMDTSATPTNEWKPGQEERVMAKKCGDCKENTSASSKQNKCCKKQTSHDEGGANCKGCRNVK